MGQPPFLMVNDPQDLMHILKNNMENYPKGWLVGVHKGIIIVVVVVVLDQPLYFRLAAM